VSSPVSLSLSLSLSLSEVKNNENEICRSGHISLTTSLAVAMFLLWGKPMCVCCVQGRLTDSQLGEPLAHHHRDLEITQLTELADMPTHTNRRIIPSSNPPKRGKDAQFRHSFPT